MTSGKPATGAPAIHDVVIRRATPADTDAILAAHRDSIESLGPASYPADAVAVWGEGLSRDLYVNAMNGGEVFFIALGEIDGHPAVLGFATHRVDDGVRHATAVYIRGSAARRGIGSALFRHAEADVIASGGGAIEISASLGAVPFYLANGFQETGRGNIRLRSGKSMACVYMTKTLPSASGRAHAQS